MSITQSIILGIIQGIAEWLPISSSGHLVLAQEFFGLPNFFSFDILLHIATLFVIFIVFWQDIKEMLQAVIRFNFKSEYGKLVLFIVFASIPTGIIGILFKDAFEGMFSNLWGVSIALAITGILLLITKLKRKDELVKDLTIKKTLMIGIAQGIAIIPGISRSGSTIGTGLLLGVEKEKAARFSFLLSIPAIIGALILERKEFIHDKLLSNNLSAAIVGFFTAIIIGYVFLKFFLKIIKLDKFYIFGYYCIGLSIILFSILIFIR